MSSASQQFCILRAAKLTTWGNVAASAQHTWRERETPNADPSRLANNVNLRAVDNADALAERIRERIALAGKNVAPDPVLAIEYFIGRSPDADIDDDAYLRDALAWIEAQHGADNVVAATIHYDEQTPHMAVYVVPLVQTADRVRRRSVIAGTNPDGSKRRETREVIERGTCKLSAAHYLDGSKKLATMQTAFAEAVGSRYGLERGIEGSGARHERVQRAYGAIQAQNGAMPRVTVPPPAMLETRTAYGQRVADAVIEQIAPAWDALSARAAMYDIERPRYDAERKLRADTARRAADLADRDALAADLAQTQEQLAAASRRIEQLQQIADGQESNIALIESERDCFEAWAHNRERELLDEIERLRATTDDHDYGPQ